MFKLFPDRCNSTVVRKKIFTQTDRIHCVYIFYPSIFTHHHLFSSIFIPFHPFSSIFIHLHPSPSIFNFHPSWHCCSYFVKFWRPFGNIKLTFEEKSCHNCHNFRVNLTFFPQIYALCTMHSKKNYGIIWEFFPNNPDTPLLGTHDGKNSQILL